MRRSAAFWTLLHRALLATWTIGCCLTVLPVGQASPKAAFRESGEGFRVGVKVRILDIADGSTQRLIEDWVQEDTPTWGGRTAGGLQPPPRGIVISTSSGRRSGVPASG